MKKPMVETMLKEKFDNLYTPEHAVYPLLDYIEDWKYKNYGSVRYIPTIWECCDSGNSKITEVLKKEGYNVVSTDITTGFDYLEDTPDFAFDLIITNPPYSIKTKFLEKCYQYNKPFALLLPLTALEGVERYDLYSTYGLSLIVLNRRIDFTGKGRCWFNASWFCNGLIDGVNRISFENIERK